MPDATKTRLVGKTWFLIAGSLAVVLLSYFTPHIATDHYLWSIEQSSYTGLSAVRWDTKSMWASTPMLQRNSPDSFASTVARTAQLRERSSAFDNDVQSLHRIVDAHHGYFEDVRTQTESGRGRMLSVAIAVPSSEFHASVAELKSIGRLVAISEVGEDANIRLANQARQLAAAKTNLERLQRLQRDRAAKLLDALALERKLRKPLPPSPRSNAIRKISRQPSPNLTSDSPCLRTIAPHLTPRSMGHRSISATRQSKASAPYFLRLRRSWPPCFNSGYLSASGSLFFTFPREQLTAVFGAWHRRRLPSPLRL